MTQNGLTGSLKTMSLPDLLQWASTGQKTGILILQRDSLTKQVHFQDGTIVGSSSNDPREYLGQFMLGEGIITEQQLKDAFDLQAKTKVMLGRILVKKGLVSESKVAECLQLKAEETIYSLFLWTEADFAFDEQEMPPGDQVMISVRVDQVLMEGLRRFDTSKQIRRLLPTNDLILRHSDKRLPPDIVSKHFPKRVYDLVDGNRTVAEIVLEARGSEFNVSQMLYAMVQKGFIVVGEPRPHHPIRGHRAPDNEPSVLMNAAKELIKSGDAEGALVILEKTKNGIEKNPELNALIQVAEEHFVERAYRHYLPPKKIPILLKPLESLVGYDLSPEEVFLVSRVNGSWDLRSIISISPLREVDALRALKKLRERGIIDLVESQAKIA